MLQAEQCKHWHMPFFHKCEVRYRVAHQVMQKCSSILEGAATVTFEAYSIATFAVCHICAREYTSTFGTMQVPHTTFQQYNSPYSILILPAVLFYSESNAVQIVSHPPQLDIPSLVGSGFLTLVSACFSFEGSKDSMPSIICLCSFSDSMSAIKIANQLFRMKRGHTVRTVPKE